MFCEQCEQTAIGQGCHQFGTCGKSPQVNAIQDLLIRCLRGLATVALKAKELGIDTHAVDVFTCEAIFATMTNVNFSEKRFHQYLQQAIAHCQNLKAQVQISTSNPPSWTEIEDFEPNFEDSLVEQGEAISYQFLSQAGANVDLFSLKLTVLYGVKGLASHTFHAYKVGQEDERVYRFINEALAALDNQSLDMQAWVNLAPWVGEMNLRAIEMLEAGHTSTYGHSVTPNPRQGKAILVSGHDIKQLEALLNQTATSGIAVYTHGELLSAHGYRKLRQHYPHLYGHYGTAWQNQTKDFAKFPGAIVITSNCLMPTYAEYAEYEDKLFSMGFSGYPGICHLLAFANGAPDFTPVIEKALTLPGFTEASLPREVKVGFARHSVLGVADRVIETVKHGKFRHFSLVGGCDEAKPDRNYYSGLVEKVPEERIVLTLTCGKFRFSDQELGETEGLPRLMGVGQCNDAYSAIQIALALAKTFQVDVNDLPLSMILSWYEQKAVAVLLTLLHLGKNNIRLGPTLPAFISPNVFKLLSEQSNLQPITTPDADLAACLN